MFLALSFVKKDRVESQITLGMLGQLTVLLAMASAAGLYSLLGYQLTHVTQVRTRMHDICVRRSAATCHAHSAPQD